MAVQIIMCGGKRTGKTTVLAAISKNIQDKYADGTIAFQMSGDSMKLSNAVADITTGINNDDKWNDPYYYPAETSGSNEKIEYPAKIKFKQSNLPLSVKFVDIPGEWYYEDKNNKPSAIKALKESEILIVAVDTPHLFETNANGERGAYHSVMNRSNDITRLVEDAWHNPKTPKMILFTLVKCERYMRLGVMKDVLNQLKEGYKELISFAKTLDAGTGCSVAAVSCKTIGGMEFDHFEQPDPNSSEFLKEAEQTQMNLRAAYTYLLNEYGEHYYKPEFCEQPLLYCTKYVLSRCQDINFFKRLWGDIVGQASPKAIANASQFVGNQLKHEEEDGYRIIHDSRNMFI